MAKKQLFFGQKVIFNFIYNSQIEVVYNIQQFLKYVFIVD